MANDDSAKAYETGPTLGGASPDGDSTVAQQPEPVVRAGLPRDPLGRFAPAPADVARLAALRANLADARGLPDAWRAQLLTELALALDAADRFLAAVAGGVTTRKGRLRAPYRDYLVIADRVATIARALGLTEAQQSAEPTVAELIARAQRRPA
jgi:hypothetical protein